MSEVASISRYGKVESFELQVARGQIAWHYPVNVFGYQPVVTTSLWAVWDVAADYVYPATPQNMLLYSSSASDTNVAIIISGLDANFNQISEVLTLTNGTTGVQTVKQYYRIQSIVNADGVAAIGTITLGNIGKTATYAQIALAASGISNGRSQMSIYTVPAGHTFYLYRVDAYSSQGGSGNNYANYRVQQYNNITGQRFEVLSAPFSNNYNAARVIPFAYTEKIDIQWQASVATGTGPIGIVVEGILIRNDA